MKKLFIPFLFAIIFMTNFVHGMDRQPTISAASLLEIVKNSMPPQYHEQKNILKNLVRILSQITVQSEGILDQSKLNLFKTFLAREIKFKSPDTEFYSKLLAYIDVEYPTTFNSFNAKCPVCMEDISNIDDIYLILSCNHVLCYECIFEHYTRHNKKLEKDLYNCCPLCKQKFSKAEEIILESDCRYAERATQRESERREQEEREEQEIRQMLRESFEQRGQYFVFRDSDGNMTIIPIELFIQAFL